MATTSTIHAQLMAQLHNKEGPIQTPYGTCSPCTSNHMYSKGPISQRLSPAHQRSTETGTRSHQTFTKPNDLKTHTLRTLLCGRQSMARCQKSHHHTPYHQAGPQTLWTIPCHCSHLTHLLSPKTPTSMEDPQCFPCIPPHSIQRNPRTWPQLP